MNPVVAISGRSCAWVVLIVALSAATLVEVLTPIAPAVARQRIKAFHLAQESWGEWIPWVLVPAMYTFSNHGEMRRSPDSAEPLPESTRIKHYTCQMLGVKRMQFLKDPSAQYAVFRSSYRGYSYQTIHRVGFAKAPGAAGPTLVVEQGQMKEILSAPMTGGIEP